MNVFYAVFPTEDLSTESLDEPISKLSAEDPHIPPITIRKARIKMRHTFDDPKGWKKYGINFYDITEKRDDFIKMKEASDTNSVYIKVYFFHNDNLMNVIKAPELDGFSACQPDQNDCRIYFNIDNWIGNNNGKNKSTLSMPRYQTYVINHEFGHGVVARAHGLKIQSSGIFLLGPLFGAFVEPNEKQLKKQNDIVQYSIYSACHHFYIHL